MVTVSLAAVRGDAIEDVARDCDLSSERLRQALEYEWAAA